MPAFALTSRPLQQAKPVTGKVLYSAGGLIMAGSKSSIFGMVGGKRQQRRT